jgi:hypothetical protein
LLPCFRTVLLLLLHALSSQQFACLHACLLAFSLSKQIGFVGLDLAYFENKK